MYLNPLKPTNGLKCLPWQYSPKIKLSCGEGQISTDLIAATCGVCESLAAGFADFVRADLLLIW